MTGYHAADVDVLITLLDPDLPLPGYAHPGDAGADLHARVEVVLAPGQRASVPTAVALALPAGFVGLVVPRSGLARKSGVGMVNAPGVIDAGYRGEIEVLLINHDQEHPVRIARGDRIAQLLIQPVARARFHQVQRLPGSHRGEGGFGSSGR